MFLNSNVGTCVFPIPYLQIAFLKLFTAVYLYSKKMSYGVFVHSSSLLKIVFWLEVDVLFFGPWDL